MSMEDLLQAILGGAGAQAPSRRAQGSSQQDPMADLLESILGGNAQQQSGGAQQGTGDIGDILGGILDGGAPQQSGGAQQGTGDIGDILGGILGGGSSMNSNTFLGPIVEKLARQLGLPPAIAQMVVSFVLSKMMGSAASKAVTPSQGMRPGQTLPSQRPSQQLPQAQQGLDLDDLLEQMSAGQTLDSGYLNTTGMTQELSLRTGMDTKSAAISLQEVFKLLGGALGSFQQTRQATQTKRTARERSTTQGGRAKTTPSKTSKSTKTSRSKTTARKRSTSRRDKSTDSGLDSLLDEFKIG